MHNSREWMTQAACRGSTLDFFPERGWVPEPVIRELCASCPVQAACLDYALKIEAPLPGKSKPPRVGIWGGLSGRQRSALARHAHLSARWEERPRLGFLCRNKHDRWKLRGVMLCCMECGCRINMTRRNKPTIEERAAAIRAAAKKRREKAKNAAA